MDNTAKVFDRLSDDYDDVFSYSEIGKRQRRRVWAHLDAVLKEEGRPLRVLELNCGTGLDGQWLADKGCEVVSTDISPLMLQKAKAKTDNHKNRKFCQLDFKNIKELSDESGFDLILSNFGGLNCIDESELFALLEDCQSMLTDSGRLVLVVMPRFCLWESYYYLSKMNPRQAFRRLRREGVDFTVDGIATKIYYHSPRKMQNLARGWFDCKKVITVGAFLPPSYLEKSFRSRVSLLDKLLSMEEIFGQLRFMGGLSDHYLIELQKNNSGKA